MKWYRNLYVSDSVARKKKKIKWKITHNAGILPAVSVITLSSNEKNLLDIISSLELMQKHYPKENLVVVGLAGSHEEAIYLAGQIVQEVYAATGGFNVREYFCGKGTDGV